jgi:hypothetical protein
MMATGGDSIEDPLIEPKVIKRLKDRSRVVDFGMREEFLNELEFVTRERRKPDHIAEEAVKRGFQRAEEAGAGVAKERTKSLLKRGNKTVFDKL